MALVVEPQGRIAESKGYSQRILVMNHHKVEGSLELTTRGMNAGSIDKTHKLDK